MTNTSARAWAPLTWSARLAAISSVSRSVMIETNSPGCTRRHVFTALRAPGIRSSAYAVIVPALFAIAIHLSLSRESFLMRTRCRSRLCCRYGEPVARLFADVVHDLLQVAAVGLVEPQLPVSARAVSQDPVYSLEDLAATAELVDDVVHEREHLGDQVAEGDLDLLAEVDELAVNAVAARAPLVLEDQRAAIAPEPEVLDAQLVQLEADGLDERRDRDGLLEAHRDVADAELDRLEEGMRTHVPPDLLPVVDRPGLHEHADEVVELRG